MPSLLSPPVQYVFKVPHADTQVMVSLMQRDPREEAALSSAGGKNFAIGFYIMRVRNSLQWSEGYSYWGGLEWVLGSAVRYIY